MKKKSKWRVRRTLAQAMKVGDVRFAGHVTVVGGFYHRMWDAKVDGKLQEGAWLKLQRDPKNMHDSNAIQVQTGDGHMVIGYIDKDEAQRIAPFMDVGVKVAARVLTHIHNPMRITARLYIKR